ncbi:MAG: hypothetical protein UY47_C0004G0055 [Parcubacteria group bacterium GW2011_GWB1_49_7]|uniref:Uncharacterized protein n=1 Tax=Candidatus Zambryskibacteria bacterium RIFCSPHIGHO2_01_FULL_46_25 TaxID=1802738 RepID=A0A1G2T054_9BACT|nr:MAG: hypothetical protein UX71_C0002G0056 [Parcubacteria group bacterium GW2011_GWA1_47_10]KKW09881.1 MAG: hypothetical protein UY47_C0004G0055 [Parcubacteria group bacterium GW2011_GWB1_49_7]OHA90655.1 MAG: hypothetical protein A2838_02980 [Candidatus Zambryskibacteria bacterium RIFCSPHIGHO2_01_FULL_46_25]OHB00599.1 MAG: hypothetical protein A3F53_02030 [Candidatus Zambryskibacteria bacterium RIFCSPHIGHO2_12_FULL_48_10]
MGIMDYENKGFVRRNIVWVIVLVAVIVFGALLFKGWDKIVNEQVDKSVTITGNFSCLPLKTGEILKDDCQLGVKSRDGLFYALDISRIQDANTDLKTDDTIAVTGFLQPIETVTSTEWSDYNVAGVIKVNTLLRTR